MYKHKQTNLFRIIVLGPLPFIGKSKILPSNSYWHCFLISGYVPTMCIVFLSKSNLQKILNFFHKLSIYSLEIIKLHCMETGHSAIFEFLCDCYRSLSGINSHFWYFQWIYVCYVDIVESSSQLRNTVLGCFKYAFFQVGLFAVTFLKI
jgi:hypothetical protein